jgi:hypothetical protein
MPIGDALNFGETEVGAGLAAEVSRDLVVDPLFQCFFHGDCL